MEKRIIYWNSFYNWVHLGKWMKKGIGQEKERKKDRGRKKEKKYVGEENKIVSRAREGEEVRTV